MNVSTHIQDVPLVRDPAKKIPIIISDLSTTEAQALAATMRDQRREVMDRAQATDAGILPRA